MSLRGCCCCCCCVYCSAKQSTRRGIFSSGCSGCCASVCFRVKEQFDQCYNSLFRVGVIYCALAIHFPWTANWAQAAFQRHSSELWFTPASILYSTTAISFYNGNLQMGDKWKEKCFSKVLGLQNSRYRCFKFGGMEYASGERCLTHRSKLSRRCSLGDCNGPYHVIHIIFLLSAYSFLLIKPFRDFISVFAPYFRCFFKIVWICGCKALLISQEILPKHNC